MHPVEEFDLVSTSPAGTTSRVHVRDDLTSGPDDTWIQTTSASGRTTRLELARRDRALFLDAELIEDGRVSFDPPLLLMNAEARPGDTWSGTSIHGGQTVALTCNVRAEVDWCPGGIAVQCDARGPVVVVHVDHFCPGSGKVGSEGATWQGQTLLVGQHSENAVLDGVPIREPPADNRALPRPAP